MRPSTAQVVRLVIAFAVAKTTIWCFSFVGTPGAFGPLMRDLPVLLLSEIAGAAIVIVAAAQFVPVSRGLLFAGVVGASQMLMAGLIEIGRLTSLDFNWLFVSWTLGVETVQPGWIVGHSTADLVKGGNWGVLALAILMLASPFLSSAFMVLVARPRALRPTSMVTD